MGVAWAIPAIIMTSAAPAQAASGCPTFSTAFGAISRSTDPDYAKGYIRFTNTSGFALQTTTTITWRVQNLSQDAETVNAFTQPASPNPSVSFSPTTTGSMTTNVYIDITVALGVAWANNGILEWRYDTALWQTRRLAHRVTITLPGCPAYTKCFSVTGSNTYRGGTTATCPNP